MPTYPGGKSGSGAAHRIITLMPVHDTYIEPFCGSAAVALLKKPARLNFLLDLDPAALDLARGDRFTGMLQFVPVGGRWSSILGDGLDFLEHHHFDGSELVYCDPPYMRSTRKSAKDLYEYEWTDHHHSRLLDWACNTAAMVIISGYRSGLYAERLKSANCAVLGIEVFELDRRWRSEDFRVMTRRGPATETLWWNFERPTVLHDDRYLGDGFRERERIRRRQKRWVSRLAKMPAAERSALIAAVQSVRIADAWRIRGKA